MPSDVLLARKGSEHSMLTNEQLTQYAAATENAAFAVLNRTTIRIVGEDRKSFFHNFCTADIKGLEIGKTCEAFILNTKGKILAHVIVLQLMDSIILTTVASQFQTIHDHLDKYIIREDVTISNETESFDSAFVCGSRMKSMLASWVEPLEKNTFQEIGFSKDPEPKTIFANCEIAGWGYLILTNDIGSLVNRLHELEITEMDDTVLNTVRIEQQTPQFGSDISLDNLPQELLRDDIAISFTKGCYLGQETVARIDSLGSVNKVIAPLLLSAAAAAGTELKRDEKTAGKITSVGWSPKQLGWMGLGYVRRLMAKPNESFAFESETAVVMPPQ